MEKQLVTKKVPDGLFSMARLPPLVNSRFEFQLPFRAQNIVPIGVGRPEAGQTDDPINIPFVDPCLSMIIDQVTNTG